MPALRCCLSELPWKTARPGKRPRQSGSFCYIETRAARVHGNRTWGTGVHRPSPCSTCWVQILHRNTPFWDSFNFTTIKSWKSFCKPRELPIFSRVYFGLRLFPCYLRHFSSVDLESLFWTWLQSVFSCLSMSSRIRAWTSSFFPRIFFKWALFKTLCRPFALIGWSGFPWWIVIFPITLVSIIHEIPYNHQPNAGFWTLLKYFAILDLASLICRLFAAINSLVLYWLRSFALKRKNIYMWFGGRCILWDKIASLLAGEEGGCILRPPKNPKT